MLLLTAPGYAGLSTAKRGLLAQDCAHALAGSMADAMGDDLVADHFEGAVQRLRRLVERRKLAARDAQRPRAKTNGIAH